MQSTYGIYSYFLFVNCIQFSHEAFLVVYYLHSGSLRSSPDLWLIDKAGKRSRVCYLIIFILTKVQHRMCGKKKSRTAQTSDVSHPW